MEAVAVIAVGLTKVTVLVDVHPLRSVTFMVYVPAPILEMLLVVIPPGVHKYVYPGVPPDAVTEADPLVAPKQVTFCPL
jgi:hypothetical protein